MKWPLAENSGSYRDPVTTELQIPDKVGHVRNLHRDDIIMDLLVVVDNLMERIEMLEELLPDLPSEDRYEV